MAKRRTQLNVVKDNDGTYLVKVVRSDTDMERYAADVIRELVEQLEGPFRVIVLPPEWLGKSSPIRTFTAYRRADISANHDPNQVNPPSEPQFEGVVFSDGKVAVRWLTSARSVSVWDSLEDMLKIHGHPEYGTEIAWHHPESLRQEGRLEAWYWLLENGFLFTPEGDEDKLRKQRVKWGIK